MTVRASCRECNMVAHYYSPITLKQIQDCPPFSCCPKDDNDCDHVWNIQEIQIGGKK